MNIVQHLKERNYDFERYVNQVIDEEGGVITVFLFNLTGQIVGFQQYNPLGSKEAKNHPSEGRYFTYRPRDTNAFWGFDVLDRNKSFLYVVEGIFKASALHKIERNAVAVLTANPLKSKCLFNLLSQSYIVIAIGDDDKAGGLLVKLIGQGFQSQDIDELPQTELLKVIEEYESRFKVSPVL